MNNYYLSSHASVNDQHWIVVPDDCTIFFYVPEGEILKNHRAFQIFKNLARDMTPGGRVDARVRSGEWIQNYNIWHLREYPDYSGVFYVGSDYASIDLRHYSEQNPFTLAQLFDKLKEPWRLYWVACA